MFYEQTDKQLPVYPDPDQPRHEISRQLTSFTDTKLTVMCFFPLPNWILFLFLLSNYVLDIIELFANLLLVLLFFPVAWNIVRNLKSQKLV